MADIKLAATLRTDVGKGASRRLRRIDAIPAVVYGAGEPTQILTLNHKEVIKALENEEFYSQILDLEIDGKIEQVVLKSMQRHPFKPKVQHMDFLRIRATETMTMLIPLHFVGEEVAPGVKDDGGMISHLEAEIEVECLPANLPKFIEVDLSSLGLNETLHLSEIKLPKGVESVDLSATEPNDLPIAAIYMPKAEKEEPIAEEELSPEVEATQQTAKEEPVKEEKE